jgi:uncharacterized protein
VEFDWDWAKAASNLQKHGISFEFAAGIFADVDRIERRDLDSSRDEERWTGIGLVEGLEIYLVYTLRGETIRPISARKANRYEREAYWNREI